MVSLTLAVIIGAFLLCIVAWFKWQAYQAELKVTEYKQANEDLAAKNEQLQVDKTVAETQVKHHNVRKQNEENSLNADRNAVLDRLQSNADLRD
ncbi:DUF2681 domain-containing protein [Actinobacillus equuli]|uniref:DUF2681 domain-containing protein n=1 Tax=Actinobacillus equuli TaxID=718 RepID=UPI0024181511|nr:DUF2681 domain-containing protein [Actinobacillus equuli]MDG4949153.1 DUF2681 domain-containing protein [Actinobacillus equuli subsp. haemolyticus]MDG4949285.1 DUF2681 domain-containing protein [Actinobacillus equuli subsp. haemolyticus]WGE52392.1 DUF2681 domain-containing protein [Actinobacillus equuli subsp. haemolyticus]